MSPLKRIPECQTRRLFSRLSAGPCPEPSLQAKVQYQAGPRAVQNALLSASGSAALEGSNKQALADGDVHISRTGGSNAVIPPGL